MTNEDKKEKCKHGILKSWCALCNPKPSKIRSPHHRASHTVHGQASLSRPKLYAYKQAIVKTAGPGSIKGRPIEFSHNIELVHINGHPFLWAINQIIQQAPKVKVIRVIPSKLRSISKSTQALCRKNGIDITVGHWAPHLAWADRRNISIYYQGHRDFLLNLDGEQKKMFDELIMFNFRSAQMAARYFCLANEEFIYQRQVGDLFGLPTSVSLSDMSIRIYSVLHYIDPTFDVTADARVKALSIQNKITKLRKAVESAHKNQEKLAAIMASTQRPIPAGIPAAYIDIYEEIAIAYGSKEMEFLRDSPKKRYRMIYKALLCRYGLISNRFTTLRQAGALLDLSCERIRQLEEEGLGLLSIDAGEGGGE